MCWKIHLDEEAFSEGKFCKSAKAGNVQSFTYLSVQKVRSISGNEKLLISYFIINITMFIIMILTLGDKLSRILSQLSLADATEIALRTISMSTNNSLFESLNCLIKISESSSSNPRYFPDSFKPSTKFDQSR